MIFFFFAFKTISVAAELKEDHKKERVKAGGLLQ